MWRHQCFKLPPPVSSFIKTLSITNSFLVLVNNSGQEGPDDDGDEDDGLGWSSPACSWWTLVVYEWFTGHCICVRPLAALTALKRSRQVHGTLFWSSWKHFFTVLWWKCCFLFFFFLCPAQTHFTSLNSLSAICLSSCIQSDNALKYFRVTIYFVKKCLRRSSQAELSSFQNSLTVKSHFSALFCWSHCFVLIWLFLHPVHIWLSGDIERKINLW